MNTLQVAFIGSGRIARIHADVLQSISSSHNVHIRGCYSKTQRNREKFCEKYGCISYDSFDELLADDIDCVYICIPPLENGIYEKVLISKNISFFVEKPIGLTGNIKQIEENLDLLKDYMAYIKVGYQWNYRKFMDSIQKFVQEQDFCYMLYNRHAMKPFIPKTEDDAMFGGALFSNLSHVVNLMVHIFDISDLVVGGVFCEKKKNFFSATMYNKKFFCSINYLGSLINKDYGGLMEILGNKGRLSVGINDNFTYSLTIDSSKGLDGFHVEDVSEGEYLRENIEFIQKVRDRKVGYEEYEDACCTLDILEDIHKKTIAI